MKYGIKKIYDLTQPPIDEQMAIRVLHHVIEHLRDNEPKRTLTARRLIMDGLLQMEMKNVSVH
jgi:hypothetical protein